MLPKKYRLDAKEFPTVYKNGVKIRGRYGMLVVKENPKSPTPLFGFVVSKKIGNAVKRHRLTRVLRVVMLEVSKELDIKGKSFQYVAFEFCDKKEVVKEEILRQMKGVL